MNNQAGFLQVKNADILNPQGEIIRLRGFCLGGWMNMENFITGYPGHESGMRNAVTQVLGPGKAEFFFERFMHYFITEKDLGFIKSLGCNVIRIPFNYRHFESDDRPFEYKLEGFALLDKVIAWARIHNIYVILDLHAVQGWQNRGWHCDNPAREAPFWGQKSFEDRAVALWEELARRYQNEPLVAGYNLMNEPDADDASWLTHFYHRTIAAIRAIDSQHIIFIEGNRYSQEFEALDLDFGENIVYSSHNYVDPAGLTDVAYPGKIGDKFYDRNQLEREYVQRVGLMIKRGIPNWVGEFGCIFSGSHRDSDRLALVADMMDIIEKHGHHWTLWTYKDIGKMGLIYPDPESAWMLRTKPVREAKKALRCDSWIERSPSMLDPFVEQVVAYADEVFGPSVIEEAQLRDKLNMAIRDTALSQVLLPAFARQFNGMSENEIDKMMQSFAFENCHQREGFTQLINRQTSKP